MYYAGIDIGGTSIKIGIFDENLNLINKWSIKTHSVYLFKDIYESVYSHCNNENIDINEILAYGVGIPGQVKDNIALKCVNLGWENMNVIEEFHNYFGKKSKFYIFNDANLAAYGEYSLLSDKYDSIVFMTLGTGVGGGVISSRIIQEGNYGIAGEIGHLKIDREFDFSCCCGKKGCLETVSSATGILNLANYLGEKYKNSVCKSYNNAKEVIDLAKEGDPIALEALDIACENLAIAMANITLVIDPNAFIIGGGVSQAGDILIEKIKEHYAKKCFSDYKKVDVKLSKLKNDAGIYGGAVLAMNNIKGVYR